MFETCYADEYAIDYYECLPEIPEPEPPIELPEET